MSSTQDGVLARALAFVVWAALKVVCRVAHTHTLTHSHTHTLTHSHIHTLTPSHSHTLGRMFCSLEHSAEAQTLLCHAMRSFLAALDLAPSSTPARVGLATMLFLAAQASKV